MGSPLLDVCRDRVHDLPVEVETEVVARGEVGEPLVADPDHAPVDLVDHGVRHRVRALELGQVRARRQPASNPVVARPTTIIAPRANRSHRPNIGSERGKLYRPKTA
jgi:hypothetical protein